MQFGAGSYRVLFASWGFCRTKQNPLPELLVTLCLQMLGRIKCRNAERVTDLMLVFSHELCC